MYQGPRKRKAGSCSDALRAEDDLRDGSGGSLINYTSQNSGHSLKRSDASTPDDENTYLSGSHRAWPLGEKIGKYKQYSDDALKSSLKISKVEYKEKPREGTRLMGHVIEKHHLIKRRRKKVKAGTEIDLTASSSVFQNNLSRRDDADTVALIRKIKPIVYDGQLDEGLLRSSTKGAHLELEKS